MSLASRKNDLSLHVSPIRQDKKMSCWYAAAQMVLSYRDLVMQVVNMTNPFTAIRYYENKGLALSAVKELAWEVGLHYDQSHFEKGFTKDTYGIYLGKLGPLWMAGKFPQGGHAVVVCGIAGDDVMIADPDPSQTFPRWMPVAQLEAIRSPFNLPVLYKPHCMLIR